MFYFGGKKSKPVHAVIYRLKAFLVCWMTVNQYLLNVHDVQADSYEYHIGLGIPTKELASRS